MLGSSASYAAAGQACAGHLVQDGGTAVLLDCGNGVLANLATVLDPLRLAAVFVSHGHPDHFLDLYALQALLRYAPQGPAPPLDLHLPPGHFERMRCLLSERGAAEFAAAFRAHELVDGMRVEAGDLVVEPREVDHGEHAFALRVTDGAATLCYTADTAPGPDAERAAAGCDLLLAEATLPEQYAGAAAHMTATEAGALAQEAGAGALVLTHAWPTNDREEMRALAAEAFGGPVSVAREFDTYDVVPHAEDPTDREER